MAMYQELMHQIVEAVRRIHGEDRWPSDVEQKVDQISELLQIILRR
jgi:hypothetical protein